MLIVVGLLLTACGEKASAPTATAPPAGGLTVGELADRMAAAWSAVKTYQTVFTTSAHAGGTPKVAASPVASPVIGLEVIDEVVVPDRKHRIYKQGGTASSEFIAANGKVYARGPLAAGLKPATPAAGDWVVVDPAAVNQATPLGQLVQSLAAPAVPPYSELSASRRNRSATPLGEVTIAGRACSAYGIADTTATGEPIDVILALGPDDLPCSIETRAGGTDNITIFTFNLPLTINAPGT
jgi:hypothetical protein